MRFVILVRATTDSQGGVMPSTEGPEIRAHEERLRSLVEKK